jgi:hypothetical protein
MDVVITKHAEKRLKQRLRKSYKKDIEVFKNRGLSQKSFKGKLKSWAKVSQMKHGSDKLFVYKNMLWVLAVKKNLEVLITVCPLPEDIRKEAELHIKRGHK